MIAHRLSTIVDADQILVLDHGRVVERARTRSCWRARGAYARMWAMQSRAPQDGGADAAVRHDVAPSEQDTLGLPQSIVPPAIAARSPVNLIPLNASAVAGRTAMRQAGMAALAFAIPFSAAVAAVKEEPVTYKAGDTTMKGFVVYDDASRNKRPGVLVVHEWWGITKHTRDEARKLASQGYTAFVVDMFGDGKTADNPKDAGALSGSVLKDAAVMSGALQRGQARSSRSTRRCDPGKDRRGRLLLRRLGGPGRGARRRGSRRRGGLPHRAGRGGAGGGAGQGQGAACSCSTAQTIPSSSRTRWTPSRRRWTPPKVNYRYVDYPGAVHAFTNPASDANGKRFNLPLAYNADADKQSKAEMTKFLSEIFKK